MIKIKDLYIPIRVLAFFSLFAFLLPIFKLGAFGLKLDLALLVPLSFLVFFIDQDFRKQLFFQTIFLVTVLVFFSMLISNSLGLGFYESLDGLFFPTEYSSFISKVLIFYCFYFIGKRELIQYNEFLFGITLVFLCSLLFGLFQYLEVPFSQRLIEIYATSENQVDKITTGSTRIFGVTGNVLTWAGWSGFIFIFTIIIYKDNRIKWALLILSSLNLLFTSSRGALISVIVSLFLYTIFKAYRKRDLKFLLKSILLSALSVIILSFLALYFFESRVLFFLDRFYFLNEALFESGRSVQLNNVRDLFNSGSLNFLFGVGKPVLDSIGLMEVEFLFIFFAYGIVGLILQYSFLFMVLKKSLDARTSPSSEVVIFGVLYFLIYSFGYFFIREIYSGLLFWSIIGYYLSRIDYAK